MKIWLRKILRVYRDPNLVRSHPKYMATRDRSFWYFTYPLIWVYTLYRLRARLRPRGDEGLNNDNSQAKLYGCMFYTPRHESEGMGGQVIKWASVYQFAKHLGLKFVHYGITKSVHSPEVDWERVLGLGIGESEEVSNSIRQKYQLIYGIPPLIEGADGVVRAFGNPIDLKSLRKTISFFESKNTAFHLGNTSSSYYVTKIGRVLSDKILHSLPVYAKGERPKKLVVAVHVRRGDVTQLARHNSQEKANRWLSADYYKRILQELSSLLDPHQMICNIFTDDPELAFDDFIPTNINYKVCPNRLQDNESVRDFAGIIFADVIVMGASSYSYVAAIVSESIVIARHPWVHDIPSTGRWIRASREGEIDLADARRKLAQHIESKTHLKSTTIHSSGISAQ